jgi:hypothetical protein
VANGLTTLKTALALLGFAECRASEYAGVRGVICSTCLIFGHGANHDSVHEGQCVRPRFLD